MNEAQTERSAVASSPTISGTHLFSLARRSYSRERLRGLTCGVAALVAAGTVLYIARDPAPGITGDSLFYLSGADALAKSGRLAYATHDWRARDSLTPMTRVMPAFAVVLAAGRSAGASSVGAARVMQAASAFVTIFLTAWLMYFVGGALAAALTSASLLALPTFLWVHLYVLTEPLFFVTLLAALLMMARPSRSPVALGVVAALAVSVRYPGVALTAAVCLSMLIEPGRIGDRLRRAVIAGLPTAILLVFWILHTRSEATAEPIRRFGMYGGVGRALGAGLSTFAAWLAPGSRPVLRAFVAAALTIVVALALVHQLRQWRGATPSNASAGRARHALGAAVLFTGCYLIVVVLSRLFADPYIEFHARMLLPALVFAQIAIALVLVGWLRTRARSVQVLVLGVIVVWLAVSARVSRATIIRERQVGLDIARPAVRESKILQWLRTNDIGDRPVFSNHPFAVFHFLARDARWWPTSTSPDTLRDFANIVQAANGLIVSFDTPDPWTTVAPDSVIVRTLGLRALATVPDGSVWELPR